MTESFFTQQARELQEIIARAKEAREAGLPIDEDKLLKAERALGELEDDPQNGWLARLAREPAPPAAPAPPVTAEPIRPVRPLSIDDVHDFDTPLTGPDGADRPRTQERPGTGVKDPIPETRSPVLLIGAAGLIATVLAIGLWQAVASSPQTASVATAAPAPTTTSRPATTAAPVASPAAAAATIRVNGQPAVYSGACNGYSVTFSWIVEGTQSGTFMMRTAKGTTAYGPESGPFLLSGSGGNLTWEPATGRLTIRGASDSGASPGFRAQITKVNNRDVEGDGTSIAAPGYCG